MASISDISRTTIHQIKRLRNNLLDLDIAINDIDTELAPRLAERAALQQLLDEAAVELQQLLRRRAA